MEQFEKELLKELKEKRKSYRSMIEFCCDNLIMNNYIMHELAKNGIYFENFCGSECYYIDNNGNEITSEQAEKMNFKDYYEQYYDVYQYFIIDSQAAELLATYTNEIVFYNEEIDLYILAVTHFGTSWDGVSANWKNIDEITGE